VHLTPRLFGDAGVYGGAERYSLELARAMARSTRTTLVAFGDASRRTVTAEGLAVHVLGPSFRVRGEEFNRLHPALFGLLHQADVIHCHQPRLVASETAALYARATGRRVFATDLGGGGWGLSSRIDTDRLFHGHLHISEFSRQAAGHEGRADASVILGGVDGDTFSPAGSGVRENLVVFVGRLVAHKGVDELIEALPDGLELEIIGRPYDEAFARRLTALAKGKRVRFRHDATDADVLSAYRRARCVALPSVYRASSGAVTAVPELLGQTLLEAMACGTPALCTSVGAMPEVVEDGVTGRVVPPNRPDLLRAALEQFRDDPERSDAMGRAGRERVTLRFAWPAVVRRCLLAYGWTSRGAA
jgi:glycosyltransferase involved in cell wall biosynthesis